MDILSLKDVSVRRGQTDILRGINWTVRAGEHWAVVGGNGSGKTTLLTVAAGYLWPTEGTVEVLGRRFGRTDLRELRRSIGFVSTALADRLAALRPHDDVRTVAVSGRFASLGVYTVPSAADLERADALLRQFGCQALADRPYSTLSQGEKQRVLLVRAWMANPDLLVLDEPCTGLDVSARELLLAGLARAAALSPSPTIIYVTHHVEEILPLFTHALVLHAGRVVAQGATRATLTDDVLSRAFGLGLTVEWAYGRPWIRVKAVRDAG